MPKPLNEMELPEVLEKGRRISWSRFAEMME
jgi:hypothetical protein